VPFDDTKEYVWRTATKFDDKTEVSAGDPVTREQRDVLGTLKMRRMWHFGFIQIDEPVVTPA
jgi:hypothetical protein